MPDVYVLNIKRSAKINLPPFLRSVLRMSACSPSPDRIVITIDASAGNAFPALGGLGSRPTCRYVDAIRAGSSSHNRLANCHDLQLANGDILVVVDNSDETSAAVAGSLIGFSEMVVDGTADGAGRVIGGVADDNGSRQQPGLAAVSPVPDIDTLDVKASA
ncbi:hypothetical protein N9K45_00160 [bacterium]|nr:hypothetical protein [bacterium]